MRSETPYQKWDGRAPASRFPRTLLAIFVATAVGAVSGVAVVLSLLSALTAETPSGVMLTKNTAEASNSGVRQEQPQATPRPEFDRSSIAPAPDSPGAFSIASQDVAPTISHSQPPPGGAPSVNDQSALVSGGTMTSEAVTSTSSSVKEEAQTQFDRRHQNFPVHHRRVYTRRFANTFLNLPFPRRW